MRFQEGYLLERNPLGKKLNFTPMLCTKGSQSTDIFPQEELDPFDFENNDDIVRRETRTRAFKNQMPRIPRLEDNTLDCGRNTFILGSAST